jgi:CHAD domain-containing protein
VPNGSREYVVTDHAGAGPDVEQALADGTGGGLTWIAGGPPGTYRRTWLDTFDWRLYRAGLTLEQTASRGGTELVLSGRDGEVLASEHLTGASQPAWPTLLAGLPPGPLRELLEPVAGVRALAPVARGVSKVTELRGLNGDGKTIARLSADRLTVAYPVRAEVPARLRLTPVRGYAGQADKAGRTLGGLPGVRPCRGSALDAALAAAGTRPGDRPGKATAVLLSPAMPAAPAMSAILTAQFDSLLANVAGTVRDVDTEFLHDLRIAVRCTRSALKLCGSALPDGLAASFRPEFGWLGQLTTPTRDLDVYLLGFAGMTAGLVGATEPELVPFRDHLARSRAAAHRQLARGLRSARFSRLSTGWRAALAGVRPARKQRLTVAGLAEARIGAAHRKALRSGGLITAASPPQSLHDLRKRCKELRYLVEMFGSLHDPAERWQAVRELKALQDCLGEFQDAEMQRAEIHAFATQMMADRSAPAATLLAMGEIAAGLALRQQRARAQFDSRFAAFASPLSQDRLSALARAAAA